MFAPCKRLDVFFDSSIGSIVNTGDAYVTCNIKWIGWRRSGNAYVGVWKGYILAGVADGEQIGV